MEFYRADGEGGPAQRWIDHNLPVCPMCREGALWTTASGVEQEALVRWYFQCPNCKVVLSTIPDDPMAAKVPGLPVVSAKIPVEINVRVESVERKQDEDFVGEEFPLYELQEWAEETED